MVDRRARIVIGFDGSPNSVLAVDWAVREADLRGGVAVLCHVVSRRRGSGDLREDEVRQAERVLAQGVSHASEDAPTVEVTGELVVGSPARQLVEASSGATLLVVGARGHGGFVGLRLGSVSAQVARHARCTVVVVPNLADRARDRRERVIVVGVDGSTGSTTALEFAFAEAARRKAGVRAIYVFDAPTVQLMANLPQSELLRLHVGAADTLRGLVAAHARNFPDVDVCCEVLSGAPASTLASAATNAELLVLGSRGHGDVATMLLGSTNDTVLNRASSPVAVIHRGRLATIGEAANPRSGDSHDRPPWSPGLH